MSNKQSSVDWLIEEIKKNTNIRLRGFDIDKAFQQAKAMHYEECKESYYESLLSNFQTFEHYYEQTFGEDK